MRGLPCPEEPAFRARTMQSEQRPSSWRQQGQKLVTRTHGGGEHTPDRASMGGAMQTATQRPREDAPPRFLAVG